MKIKRINEHNWEEIQEYYDSGHTWREVTETFSISMATLTKAYKFGIFRSRDRSEARKLSIERFGASKHTEETKAKISRIRIKYIEEHPDKAPYKLNHYTKGPSYPERYFRNVLTSLGVMFEEQKQVGPYCIDFAIAGNIDLEIDGNQHYYDLRIMESDKRRTKYLTERGWTVIRIRWSDYSRMSKKDRETFIGNTFGGKVDLDKIEKLADSKDDSGSHLLRRKKQRTCLDCNKPISKNSKRCRSCGNKFHSKRKVCDEDLLALVNLGMNTKQILEKTNLSAAGKNYKRVKKIREKAAFDNLVIVEEN